MAPPVSTDVNKPVDVKKKDADVNRKLQIYGIITAFQNGKTPSNDQIDVALNSFLDSRPLARPSDRLSAEGKALVADVRNVVKEAQRLILSKNEGNLVQDFAWQTTHFDPSSLASPDKPVNKETAKMHGDRALEGLRTLGTLIITNGQFRKLLKDSTTLLRDMAGDAATKAAANVKPSSEDLDQIDHPADDNTWHDKPDFSKDNLKKQVQGVYKSGDTKAAKTSVSSPDASSAPRGPAGNASSPAPAADALNAASDTVPGGVSPRQQQRVEQLANEASEAGEAAKTAAAEYRTRTKEYLSRKMPKERREQLVWRLKKMVIECQQHPDYQRAIQTLLDLAEQYGGHARTLGQDGSSTVKDARSGLGQAEADLKTLIERFANGTSTDDLWSSINQVYEDAENDPELRAWLKDVNKYIRRCLEEQGYVLDESSTDEWNQLHDRGNYLLRDKYRAHTDRIVDEIKFLADQFDQDAQNQAFAQSVRKLFTDLGNDESGKPTFKKHLVKDLSDVIIPAIFENVAYIPIPRIEFSDHQVDVIIENLVLESDNFMPNVLEIASENYLRWGRKTSSTKNKHAVEVKVSGVQMDLRDVSYHVNRKQGFPSLTDTGVADIYLGGQGFSFKLKMSTADDKDSQKFFKVDKVDVDLKNPKIKLSKSNHKLLFNLAKPLMLKVLRPAMQKAVEKAIRDNVDKLDAMLFRVKFEADRALDEAQSSPEDIPNIYSRYITAAQKQILMGKKKAEEIAADKKVNYAVTKQDSIFPDIHLPGGINSKATEYRELALKGDKWESPVFSIGTASKSTDIPSPPEVVRKPHVTNGTTAPLQAATGNGASVGGGRF